MRRLWVVVAGFVGLVGGLVVGFSVGARFWIRPWNPAWVEAWGTWVAAIASTAILAILTIRSERFTTKLEATRQAREDDKARQSEQEKADGVLCNAWPTDHREEDGTRVAGAVVVKIINHSGGVLNDVMCEVPFGGIGSVYLRDVFAPEEEIGPMPITASEPIRLRAEAEARELVVFTFWLNGVRWSRCPAEKRAKRMQAESSLIKH